MSYNQNSGYGKSLAESLHNVAANGGKVFMVAKVAQAGRQILQEVFNVDPDGINRWASTIDQAIGYTTASRGDVVLVAPGHTETIQTAGGITLDVAGVSVIGLGVGNNRPVITMATSNGATIAVSGSNCKLENVVVLCAKDGLTNAVVVTGDNCTIDIETQDTSQAVEAATMVRLDSVENTTLRLKHNGYPGNAGVSLVTIDGSTYADIHLNAIGKWSTSVVDFVDVASSGMKIFGYVANAGTTDGSKDITDTITGSDWYGKLEDGAAGAAFAGGSAVAWASDDVSSVAADAAAILVDTGTTLPATLGAPAGASMSADIAAVKVDTAAILVDTGATIPATLAALPQCVAKSDGAILTGNDDLFVISGGPVRCKITGIVVTVVGGASNMDLQCVTISPAGTFDLNAAPVAIDSDAAGTLYYNVGATSVFTPVTAGAKILDPVTVEETEFILPPGTVHARGSAAQTGVIAWFMEYTPLSPLSVVTAAA